MWAWAKSIDIWSYIRPRFPAFAGQWRGSDLISMSLSCIMLFVNMCLKRKGCTGHVHACRCMKERKSVYLIPVTKLFALLLPHCVLLGKFLWGVKATLPSGDLSLGVSFCTQRHPRLLEFLQDTCGDLVASLSQKNVAHVFGKAFEKYVFLGRVL